MVLLDGCPLFLKEQFINYILCVTLRRQICGLSVPSHQWETKRHLVIQILSKSLDGLVCQKTPQSSISGVGRLPGCKEFGYWLPSHGYYAEGCVYDVPQRKTIQAVLLGPWQQKDKTNWVQILKRNCFEKAELGFRQNFLQGSFWLSVIFIDLQQLRSSARREESKHSLLGGCLRKTQ